MGAGIVGVVTVFEASEGKEGQYLPLLVGEP